MYFLFLQGMTWKRLIIRTITKGESTPTIMGGIVLLVALHWIIKFEQIKDNGAFQDLDIPIRKQDDLYGIKGPEEFPLNGPDRIPKILHQTWKNTQIPSKFIKWIKTWLVNHPDWEYWLWTDDSARKLIQDKYPHLLEAFNGYNEGIRKADALRYIILYEFGGVYADMDMESLHPIDPWLKKYPCFVSQEPYEHPVLDGNFEHLAINALIGCRPKHPFMKQTMNSLPAFQHMWNVLDSTGPHFMTLNFNEYVKNHKTLNRTDEDFAYLVPSEYFFPTIDPAKYFWFRHQCGKFYKLSKIQQKACMTLKVKGVKRKPPSWSFTRHHWEHTYIDLRLSLKGPVNIFNLVPKAKIYSSQRTKKVID